ncbi:MAG: MFS transporter [Methanomicrobiaceae archaeon]|nr:MFS transporter [Methanomicrobiaceae archaeon]
MILKSFIGKLYSVWSKNSIINLFCMMILFFMLYDVIITYAVPLIVTEQGYSKTLLGIIFSTAAISGAFFDFVIYKIFKKAFYRTLFIFMFLVCVIYVFFIWSAHSFFVFVAAMAMWGFYYDLQSFGTLDLFSRYVPKKDLSSRFGVLQIFQASGCLLAPLIAGFLIIDTVGWEPFVTALVFLSVSAFFFLLLLREAAGKQQFIPSDEIHTTKTLAEEFGLWRIVGSMLFPLLLLISVSTVFDAFFITIGPIVAENLPLEPFDGLFMVAFFAPPLIIGGLIGSVTKIFGEKKTALIGLFIGSSILTTISFIESPLIIILIVFISTCFTCMLTPVSNSISAHCIQETPKFEKEVQELSDFFFNIGYIIGPVFAGIIADTFGEIKTFSVLGGIGIIFAIILFVIMPEKLNLNPS